MELASFDALSFDCYGTLIDWESGIAAVLGPWARARGLDLDDEALLAAYAGHEAARRGRASRRPVPAHPGRAASATSAASWAPRSPSDDAGRLAGSVPDWPAFADSHAALAALAQRYQLIILSNVDRDSFAASNRRLGVTFTSVLTAEDIGSYKPSPRNFDGAAGRSRTARASRRAGCCTWPRACSTTTSRRSRRACPPSGSTGGTTGPAGARPRRPPASVSPDAEFPSMQAFADAATAQLSPSRPRNRASWPPTSAAPPGRFLMILNGPCIGWPQRPAPACVS